MGKRVCIYHWVMARFARSCTSWFDSTILSVQSNLLWSGSCRSVFETRSGDCNHGQRKGGSWLDFESWPFSVTFLAKEGRFLSFEKEKIYFTTFGPPWKNVHGYLWKIRYRPPVEKVYPTPMTATSSFANNASRKERKLLVLYIQSIPKNVGIMQSINMNIFKGSEINSMCRSNHWFYDFGFLRLSFKQLNDILNTERRSLC